VTLLAGHVGAGCVGCIQSASGVTIMQPVSGTITGPYSANWIRGVYDWLFARPVTVDLATAGPVKLSILPLDAASVAAVAGAAWDGKQEALGCESVRLVA